MAIDRAKITKQAETYMTQGRVDRAIDEFLKLLEDKPDDWNLMNRVGDAFLQSGRVPEAIDMFKRAGIGYERGGFTAKASAVFKKAHRTAPDDLDICERLAELYRATNMVKDAIQIHIGVAETFTKKGLLKRALEEFAKVVELDPKNQKNKVKLADLYNKEGMKEKAAAIYLDVAEALAMEQMHAEAGQILERAKAMVSTPQVFLTQSRLAVIQKDLASAASHLREGLAANPRSAELLDALAEVELQAKAPDRALEALAEVPQLPEKSLGLAERALREMARTGHVDEALKLFKPIGREFARRGMGEAAAKALRGGLHGAFNAEAWIQMAEIAHQSGNRAEQVDHLRRALAAARAKEDDEVAASVLAQLQGMGIADADTAPAPSASQISANSSGWAAAPAESGEHTELDAARRIQIQQLEREAEQAMRSRFMDRAQEAYAKILELEPANYQAIVRIAEIHRSTGILSKVQMHYVKHAEKLAALGNRALAVDLLDLAENLFPGSTRLYRRNLGLLDVLPVKPIQPALPPAPPVISLPPPPEPLPVPVIELETLQELEPIQELESIQELPPIIPLDLPPVEAILPGAPAARPDPFASALEVPGWEPAAPAAPAAPDYPSQPEYDWAEITGGGAELPPLELEPLPFATPGAPAPVTPELASWLSDIDFQLDYGSPEEAKIEIENALKAHPAHPELVKRMEAADAALVRLGMPAAGAPPDAKADFEASFFDLSDVLGDALLETGEGEEMHDATNVVEKIQSVDELFNAFREGVEQQVRGDDYETHYNLGIAYKEMMLLEPAMEEFKKAMRDPERTLECCSMLAICELAQNNPDAAAGWLRQGIDAPGFPPEDSVGLHYDLGILLMGLGRREEALEEFRTVAAQDPDYRDVAQMIS